jgi:hypothetical protein
MKRMILGVFTVAALVFTPSPASATYVTFENLWNSSYTFPTIGFSWNNPITFVNMGFWNITNTVELGEIWSSDYGLRPPDSFPLDITNQHPLLPGHTYTTPVIPFLADSAFRFTGLGAGGTCDFPCAGWFTGVADVSLGYVVIPGSAANVINALWPTGGSGPGCETCGTVPILRATFHDGAPVPEPPTVLLFGIAAVCIAITRTRPIRALQQIRQRLILF